ncbi:hypothetical protein LOTGIDRAFT_231273 [Lottia gigantea]|uniref:Major facilitator superfamily (MFS) profile domain-containing protein n=1 Tax=Lottia gigantea TaxID=225164 RepID=V4AP40_LOTGI|nr:hypothetical protein LOTGIDRAFT_231273 [Lottia gigantea]ESO98952.1 hypothetical protein LOTGIDRAFT_231273 [Lottia gigantea]
MTERTEETIEDDEIGKHDHSNKDSLLKSDTASVIERQSNDGKDEDEDEDEGLPIDRGWAWVVAIAVQINIAIVIGYTRAFGILFIEFLQSFKASVAETTLVTAVMAAIFGISVFISMQVLVGRFQERTLVMTGGIIASMGIITSYFATNVVELILSQGIFLGIGNSLIHGPGLVLVGKYFKKKRALANAVANSGISAGSVLFPPLAKALLDAYGLRGTLLVLGGINLHVLVCGALLRPLNTFKRHTSQKVTMKSTVTQETNIGQVDTLKIRSHPEDDEVKIDSEIHSVPLVSQTYKTDLRNHSETGDRLEEFQSQSDIYSFVPPETINKAERKMSHSSSVCNCLKNFGGSLGFYLWKDPTFICLILVTALAIFLILFLNYFPAFVTDNGTSEQDAAIFISVAGAIDFFARLGVGFFANAGFVKRRYICAFGLFVSGINCHMLRFYTTYKLQLAGIIIYGLCGGIYNSFIPVLLSDILGVQHLAKSLGFTMITHGLVISLYHPLVGALKDITGSYITSFHVMGTSVILGGALLLAEPLFEKCKKKLKESNGDVKTDVMLP